MRPYDECHSYLSHLQSEHHRLEMLVRNIIGQFARATELRWAEEVRAEVAARLSALQVELLRHFETENEGGCIDEAVSRRPSLSSEAKEIYLKSDQLRAHLDDVFRLIEFGDRFAAEEAFREFANELRDHERREELLLEQGMNVYRRER